MLFAILTSEDDCQAFMDCAFCEFAIAREILGAWFVFVF